MSNLENIKNKIKASAEQEARVILEESEREREQYLARIKEEVSEEIERQIAYTHTKAQTTQEQIMAGAGLKARDMVLSSQQGALTKIFDAAKERLTKMSDGELSKLVRERLKTYQPETGDVLVLPEGRSLDIPKDIPVEYDPRMKVGFALKRGGVSEKYDFLEILDFERENLERSVLDFLRTNKE